MPTHRGFSAWIQVEGRTLPEYCVCIDKSATRISCWIPSEEGKAFTVCWSDHGGGIKTCGYITLDGYIIPGRFLHGEGTAWRGSIRTGQSYVRPFIFQKVQHSGTDGSTAMDKDVGMIVLRIKRVKLVEVALPIAIQQPPDIGSSWQGIRVGFGEDQLSFERFPATWAIQPYDNPGQSVPSTYVSFAFYYRTPEFLCAHGIISNYQVSNLRHENFMPPVIQLSDHLQPYITRSMPVLPGTVGPYPDPLLNGTSSDPVYISLGPQESSVQEGDRNKNSANFPGEGIILF